jgi:hypothetical protein
VVVYSALCATEPLYADDPIEHNPCISASELLGSVYAMSFNLHSAVISTSYSLSLRN